MGTILWGMVSNPWSSGHACKTLITSSKAVMKFMWLLLLMFICYVLWWLDDKMQRHRHRTASKTWLRGVSVSYATCSKARAKNPVHARTARAKGHEAKDNLNDILAGKWIHEGHGWAPDSALKKGEWAGKCRRKLQAWGAVRKCPCAACWTQPKTNKLKLNHRKTANLHV